MVRAFSAMRRSDGARLMASSWASPCRTRSMSFPPWGGIVMVSLMVSLPDGWDWVEVTIIDREVQEVF